MRLLIIEREVSGEVGTVSSAGSEVQCGTVWYGDGVDRKLHVTGTTTCLLALQ